jgi:hypothetical protein
MHLSSTQHPPLLDMSLKMSFSDKGSGKGFLKSVHMLFNLQHLIGINIIIYLHIGLFQDLLYLSACSWYNFSSICKDTTQLNVRKMFVTSPSG